MILLVIGLLCLGLFVYHLIYKIVITKTWTKTTAKIIRIKSQGNRRHPSQMYFLEYESEGQKYVGQYLVGTSFSEAIFDAYLNADRVEISYAADHKKVSIPSVKEDWVFIVILLFWSIFCLVLALNIP